MWKELASLSSLLTHVNMIFSVYVFLSLCKYYILAYSINIFYISYYIYSEVFNL